MTSPATPNPPVHHAATHVAQGKDVAGDANKRRDVRLFVDH